MLTREKNKIVYLHFIMSVLVILIHSINNDTKFQMFFSIDNGIGQFAVPLFFIISGFLFFRNISSFDSAVKKLCKRIYTVLVPYLLWNLIYYMIHLLLKPANGLNLVELYDAVLNYRYNPSFWFIYQLMLLIAISPIIILLTKKVIYIIILLVAILFAIAINFDIFFINEDAMVYYIFGALFSTIYNRSKVYFIDKKNVFIFLIIAITMFLLNRLLLRNVNFGFLPVSYFTLSVVLVRLSTAMFIFYLIDWFFSYEKTYAIMNNTFFLYAIHYMIVKAMIIFMKFIMYKFLPSNLFVICETITFVASPIVCVVISYYLSDIMIKKIPKVYYVLTGNRR